MAQFGKFEFTLLDNDGNALPNISISIRTQGAFITSTQAGPTYTVNDPGGILAGSSLNVNLSTSPTRTASSVTATQVVVGGAGFGTLVNNDRLVSTTTATLFNDAQGAESKSNPLTTDASGKAYCWVEVMPYDIIYTGTGYTSRIEYDRVPGGIELGESNVFTSATAKAFRRATTRTLTTAGALIETWENPVGVVKMSIDKDGDLTVNDIAVGGNETIGGNLTVTGNAAVTGTLGVTGNTTLTTATATGLITASAGITSAAPFTYSGAAGSFALTAGSIETADLADNATYATFIGTGTTDFVVGAAYAAITSVSVTMTPFSTDSELIITAVIPMTTDAAAGDMGIVIKHGATILHEALTTQAFAGSRGMVLTCIARQTGLSGSQTWTVEAKCSVASKCLSSSTDQKAKLVVMEFKK